MASILLVSNLILLMFAVLVHSQGNFVGKKSIGKKQDYLDRNKKYLVEWEAFTDTQTIIFDLTVETTGFIGFGISPTGGMTAADITIGGVFPNGLPYFSNRHGIGNEAPVIDDHDTWELLGAAENGTHTRLKVGRMLNTCDVQDVAIGNSTTNFIWSMGSDDNISYHGDRRGTSAQIVLDPPMPPNTNSFQSWRMTHTMEMPAKTTTYWCTVHKSPPLSTKHHIVGFRPVLDTPEALKHIHHYIVMKCIAPAQTADEEYFERFINQTGGECGVGGASNDLPMSECNSILLLWAVGGKPVHFPEHTGYPFAVDGKTSYYMIQVHYNNPQSEANISFEAGMEIFYTSELREFDAGTITTGHMTTVTIIIPPKTEEFVTVGHCSPVCSNRIPANGIHVFTVLLHSHIAGRKLRLRHFRNGTELPWLSTDDNYDFDYQQSRPLLEEVTIFPGDQLTLECTFNSMNANGTVIGGLATTDEMCNAYILYYPEIDMHLCSSNFPSSQLRDLFGIESFEGYFYNPTITAPESMANKSYTEVMNTMVPWTEEFIKHFQQVIRYADHDVVCRFASGSPPIPVQIAYPNITNEFVPIDECDGRNLSSSANARSQFAINIIECIYVVAFVLMLSK